jgi:hypothetical protein
MGLKDVSRPRTFVSRIGRYIVDRKRFPILLLLVIGLMGFSANDLHGQSRKDLRTFKGYRDEGGKKDRLDALRKARRIMLLREENRIHRANAPVRERLRRAVENRRPEALGRLKERIKKARTVAKCEVQRRRCFAKKHPLAAQVLKKKRADIARAWEKRNDRGKPGKGKKSLEAGKKEKRGAENDKTRDRKGKGKKRKSLKKRAKTSEKSDPQEQESRKGKKKRD